MAITIKHATRDDIGNIYSLVVEQANETNKYDEVHNFQKELSEASDENKCLIASTEDDIVVAYAIYTSGFHVWRGAYFCLEQLYVRPKNRQQKIAQLLLEEIFSIARAENKQAVRWENQPDNEAANALYMKLGADLAVRHRYNYTIKSEGSLS